MRPQVFAAIFLAALPFAGATDATAQYRDNMRFRAMDQNRDGVITRAEWRGSDQSFRAHDWNGDGRLSGDEVRVGAVRQNTDEDYNQQRLPEFYGWDEAGFARLDRNRDGRVSRNEWQYDTEAFRRADRNGDGVLTQREFLAADVDDDRDDRFVNLDANRNGRIERSEWHGSRDAFQWLDRNNDGSLSRVEVLGEETAEPDQFASLDYDRNGRIALDEWPWSRRSFTQQDRNGDGALTRDELSSTELDAIGTSGQSVATPERTVIVDPRVAWIDTGIDVRPGDVVSFNANGSVQLSQDGNDVAAPSGAQSGRFAQSAPLRNAPAGALIARVGNSTPVVVGERGQIDNVPYGGRLYLGVNDDHLADNAGQFRVSVTVRRR